MKIHYIEFIAPDYGDGWALCGKLIKQEYNYDEDIPGRNEITCKNCSKVVRAEGKRD